MAGKHREPQQTRRRDASSPSGRRKSKPAVEPIPTHTCEHGHELCFEESQISLSLPMERLLRVVRHAAADNRFRDMGDVDTFLERFSEEDYDRALAGLRASGPRAEAQQLAYDAILDAKSDRDAIQLAKRALTLHPQCVDAMVVLAECTNSDHAEAFIEALRQAVEVGERALGAEFLKKHAGRIWEELDARPYLRARYRLADGLRVLGRLEEATGHLEALLKLNPHDHQRARDPLLACRLANDDLEGARELLLEFSSDHSAVFHWGRVLERLLAEDEQGAGRALKRAREQNRFAERYVTFVKKPRSRLPDSYLPGDEDEALHCLFMLGMAWAAHPDAVLWVRDQPRK